MKSLTKFIPSNYAIICVSKYEERYFSSDWHKQLLKYSLENKLISELQWDLSVVYSLPLESLEIDTFILIPSYDTYGTTLATSICCGDLIYNINKTMTNNSWRFYLSIISTIKTKLYHLHLENIDASFCTLILKEIKQGQWKHRSFHRILLSEISIADSHLKDIIELVKKNRIKKGIYLRLNENHKVTMPVLNQLWKFVIQSSSIDEFSFSNRDTQFNPVFDFSVDSNGKSPIPFQMLDFVGFFTLKQRKWECCIESIQELMLHSGKCPEADLRKFFKSNCSMTYLQCDAHLISFCVSSNRRLCSALSELHVFIDEKVSFLSLSSVVNQIRSL